MSSRLLRAPQRTDRRAARPTTSPARPCGCKSARSPAPSRPARHEQREAVDAADLDRRGRGRSSAPRKPPSQLPLELGRPSRQGVRVLERLAARRGRQPRGRGAPLDRRQHEPPIERSGPRSPARRARVESSRGSSSSPPARGTGVAPLVTTCFGPRTAAAGFTGRTWLTTSQSPSMRIRAARCCFTVGTDPGWVRM